MKNVRIISGIPYILPYIYIFPQTVELWGLLLQKKVCTWACARLAVLGRGVCTWACARLAALGRALAELGRGLDEGLTFEVIYPTARQQ